jgi:hypothetical protein
MCQETTPKEPDDKEAKRNLKVGDVVRAVEGLGKYIIKGQLYVVTKASLHSKWPKNPMVKVRPYGESAGVDGSWRQNRFEYLSHNKMVSLMADTLKPHVRAGEAKLLAQELDHLGVGFDLREPEAKRYRVIGTGYGEERDFASIDELVAYIDSKWELIGEGTYTVAVEYGEIEVKRKTTFKFKE